MLDFNKIPCSKVANKQYTCNKATLIKYRKIPQLYVVVSLSTLK